MCCFSLQCCESAQLTKCDGTFWDTFKREVISRYKIQNQVGFCTDIGSFLMSYVRAGNKINSIPYSVWTVVLCFTQTYQLRFPLIQQSKNMTEKITCILFFFFFLMKLYTSVLECIYIYALQVFISVPNCLALLLSAIQPCLCSQDLPWLSSLRMTPHQNRTLPCYWSCYILWLSH